MDCEGVSIGLELEAGVSGGGSEVRLAMAQEGWKASARRAISRVSEVVGGEALREGLWAVPALGRGDFEVGWGMRRRRRCVESDVVGKRCGGCCPGWYTLIGARLGLD